MKKMKRFLGLLLAVIMVLSMSVAAFAAGEGSITISGTVSGKTYELYKIFDLTQSGDNVAYTIDADWTAFFEGDGKDYIVETDITGSLNQIVVDGSVKYINITDANVADFSTAAQDYAADLAEADQTATGTGSDVTVGGLDLGYYLVYPKGAADVKEGNSCICSLTSTVPSATVTIKATYPTIEKTEDKTTADVGEKVTYTITGQVPDTTGYDKYTYKISDTMTDGLTLNEDVKVVFGEDDDAKIITVTPAYADNGFTVEFDMTQYQDYAGKKITVTYTATVNENAIAQIEENHATLEYSHDPKDETKTETTPPENVKIYTSKIVIDKVDGADKSTKLQGAEFVLKNADGKFYKYTDAADSTADIVGWVDNQSDATVVTTDENGAATFKGLKDGIYTLVEIKAPAGYNLLTTTPEITVSGSDADETKLTITSEVENNSGAVLPSTGGTGTTIFYILGSVLVLGAAVILVTRKRMSAEE